MTISVNWDMPLDEVLKQHQGIEKLATPDEYKDARALAVIRHVSYWFSPIKCTFIFDKQTELLVRVRIEPDISGLDYPTCTNISDTFDWLLMCYYGRPTTKDLSFNGPIKRTTWMISNATLSVDRCHIDGILESVSIDYSAPADWVHGKDPIAVTIVNLFAEPAITVISSVSSSIDKYRDVLRRKYSQTSYVDDYGIRRNDKWISEINYFMESVLSVPANEDIRKIVSAFIDSYISDSTGEAGESSGHNEVEQLDPVQFESFCATALSANGWDAHTTRRSGDQGADVIAVRGKLRVVVQCKLYSSPIGNKAVQEAIAGKVFENADFACVVSNMSFTIPARQLAEAAGVLLLHYGDLPKLHEMIADVQQPN